MNDFLLLRNIKIHNANALSSPYTIGFPAMTAWLGFMHALQRKFKGSEFDAIKLTGIIISCHDLTLHTHKGKGDYVSSIKATSNPLDKAGKRPSFIEEARCDLEVSIAIECEQADFMSDEPFTRFVDSALHRMKIASGDINQFKPTLFRQADNYEPRKITKYLMPGYCLISRQSLMTEAMQDGSDAIDALLSFLKTTTDININDSHKITRSKAYKKKPGWLVPIAVGYQGISDAGLLENTRDVSTQHRFAESIVTLGEFKMAHHFQTIEQLIWRYQEYKGDDCYLCYNQETLPEKESKL